MLKAVVLKTKKTKDQIAQENTMPSVHAHNQHNHLGFFKFILVIFVTMAGCSESEVEVGGSAGTSDTYDIVINSGRVIDPETALDAIRSIGIEGGEIAEISESPLDGAVVIDAGGLVVSPGFIDLHVHGHDRDSNKYQVHDGVTTALELELGIPDMDRWVNAKSGNSLINFGASASYQSARTEATDSLFGRALTANEGLNSSQVENMRALIVESLSAGAIGIGLPIGYVPGASPAEFQEVFEIGAERDIPVFVHLRNPDISSFEEAIDHARAANSSIHIMHVNSMALGEIDSALALIENAQNDGIDVTTEVYPYTAGSTYIETAIFDAGWQERFNISYNDLQWQDTGERLTEETFNEYRKSGGPVIIHMMREEWIETALADDKTIIASDGMVSAPGAHPRTAGTFSRVLGRYVRETQLLDLNEAITKMTLMPALRLESAAPMASKKGRIQVGMDADITIFDPAVILDMATFEGGLEYSAGIEFVIVNGVLVLRDGEIVENTYPGEPVFGKYKD